MIKIYSTGNPLEADMIKTELDACGIKCYLENYNVVTLDVGPYNPLVKIDIYVSKKDFKENRKKIQKIIR